MPSTEIGSTIAEDMLRAFVERIETVSAEKDERTADIRDIYSEVKSAGLDTKIVRAVVRRRKLERAERQEHDALLDLYEAALGE